MSATLSSSRLLPFAKGHGTENDFVLLVDAADERGLTSDEVVALCDRRAGIGADGVLRAVRAGASEDWASGADDDADLWFMDYRNADGSLAEMCGNGIRVFVCYLVQEGLARPDAAGAVPVATRGGLRTTWLLPDGRVRVAMGPVEVGARDITVVPHGGPTSAAYRASVGNPHAVSLLDPDPAHLDLSHLDLSHLDLSRQPDWSPTDAFPDGVNLEFVHRIDAHRVAMRVFERGSGETRSCGTGTCAVAAVAAADAGQTERPLTYVVDVPGGSVEVELTDADTFLTGPAVVVARGVVEL